MENIQYTKDRINQLYLSTIQMMEDHDEVNKVRQSLLEVASMLNAFASTSNFDKANASNKANMLLNYAKRIREENSYTNIYRLLTGKELKQKVIPVETKKVKTTTKEVKEEVEAPVKDYEHTFDWHITSNISFKDVAGLDEVKEEIKTKVILPLTHPELYEGYESTNGGGLLLYGPPGTGKSMIGAAIANELNASFCCITPSSLLTRGVGESEKLIRVLFEEARSFDVAVIYFDEMEALCPKNTHSQVSRQIRSELLTQIQGLQAYSKDKNKILYLIASTNKPWDVDPAFIRPGRFGTRIYINLPDEEARRYMVNQKLNNIKAKGLVELQDINVDEIVKLTEGYSGADMSYLLDEVQVISIKRSIDGLPKYISNEDFMEALKKVTSSIQEEDIRKLLNWKKENNS